MQRHIQMRHSERGQRVQNGVDDGRRCPDGSCLTDSLDPGGGEWRWGDGVRGFDSRNVLGAREGVSRPVVGDKRTFVVVTGALEQRLAESLCDAAVYLSARQQWVDQRPAVVDREEPLDGDVAGRGVDLDNGDVGAEREREFLGL